MIKYQPPAQFMHYDFLVVAKELVNAKAAVMSLTALPFQRSWAEVLQQVQLKYEVAGTSKIEGADFTETELDAALSQSFEDLVTRSQKQAKAAVDTYRWIAQLEDDRPVSPELIKEVHRRIVTGADDDHCEPGQIRGSDQNVIFGIPPHRGADGGADCEAAFRQLCHAIEREFNDHDLLIQALALHYHFAAIHPFLDGNGRTARALEALMLQRAGLRQALFIAMSNYYYDEKIQYLETLGNVRSQEHDLTQFLIFGLKGITVQCKRLFDVIRTNIAKEMYRNLMYDLFTRLETPKKRVIRTRQLEILKILLKHGQLEWPALANKADHIHQSMTTPRKALVRDINYLSTLGAIHVWSDSSGSLQIKADLDWPSKITETEFYEKSRQFSQAKPHSLPIAF